MYQLKRRFSVSQRVLHLIALILLTDFSELLPSNLMTSNFHASLPCGHRMTLFHQLTSPSAKYPGVAGLMISRFTYYSYYLLLFSFTSGSLLSNPQLMTILKLLIYLAFSKQQALSLTLSLFVCSHS